MDGGTRSARLEARIAPEVLKLVRQAAELEGRSVGEFVAAAAGEAARSAIERERIIRLSIAEQERFAALLLDPPPANETLRRARTRHADLFGPA